jgi:hypothetical protein
MGRGLVGAWQASEFSAAVEAGSLEDLPWSQDPVVSAMWSALSEQDKASLLSASRRSQATRDLEEDEAEGSAAMGPGAARGRKRKRRLRSRNVVVDKWLEDEEGSDAYADLEDFIVEEEYTTYS